MYRVNAICIGSLTGFLCRNSQADPKIHMEMQKKKKNQNIQNILKENKLEDIHFLILKLTIKIQIIKLV